MLENVFHVLMLVQHVALQLIAMTVNPMMTQETLQKMDVLAQMVFMKMEKVQFVHLAVLNARHVNKLLLNVLHVMIKSLENMTVQPNYVFVWKNIMMIIQTNCASHVIIPVKLVKQLLLRVRAVIQHQKES